MITPAIHCICCYSLPGCKLSYFTLFFNYAYCTFLLIPLICLHILHPSFLSTATFFLLYYSILFHFPFVSFLLFYFDRLISQNTCCCRCLCCWRCFVLNLNILAPSTIRLVVDEVWIKTPDKATLDSSCFNSTLRLFYRNHFLIFMSTDRKIKTRDLQQSPPETLTVIHAKSA